ncbi:uncharacterized protein DSM5745_05043 [Aspergillus mulundensis]|uniref:Uncharacterized protein n=1 Tax=Aspergillus mulundensis TaxID=1810919 RepID=A0A3D8S5G2_9EURO|nr:hypothetical protein DSM5745_05043 [Aspergillus mulundensis]RDW81486.1 hypothetical protein DSM5745_05043 [Aspergillus mulundensis]
MNALINLAGLAVSGYSFFDVLKSQDVDTDKVIGVTVLTGSAPNAGGSIPHLAVFDENGDRIGQYKGDADGHINEDGTKTFSISPTQNGGKQASPDYLLMAMHENDALCITAIIVSGNSHQWAWTGDMAYTCDAQWYHSKRSYGSSNVPIRCAWFDADHSNGIKAKGLTIHLPSFATDDALLQQYKDKPERLCRNTRRMTFHPEIRPDDLVTFFRPPPEYTMTGAMKDPDQENDRDTNAYPDGKGKREHAREWVRRNVTAVGVSGLKNNNPDLLIVSRQSHSARELCEHPMSLGPDFVDVPEKTFCDMETGRTWPLCEEASAGPCFDLGNRQMKYPSLASSTAPGVAKFAARVKTYKSFEEW